ncbi:MAG: SET domain-containing protein-lysine N-methyltransferase [Minicystis sp.]
MSRRKFEVIERDRIRVKRSTIHGRGVFAATDLQRGECIIEYRGERIDWEEALARHPHDLDNPHHTFYFSLEGGNVIDAKVRGNAARWINHSCSPNCVAVETVERDPPGPRRVFIFAKKNILTGTELFYDYGLELEGRKTKAMLREHACHCGQKRCRGTMLRT